MHNKAINYRPDIDGLRALAVLSVVIFHFNKEWLPGGFVGVDIFFVISGYLITGIVSRQAEKGNFSFYDFYLRRIRRILPAALFATFVTLLFGLTFMLPDDAEALSASSIAATVSAANVYFWLFLDTSYFAESSDTVPLLHMWSLGVEEQFYLIWPAFILLACKFGGRRFLLAASAFFAIVSFLVGEYFIKVDPTFAYYMLPARAGELIVGGMIFVALDMVKKELPRWANEIMALTGIGVLLFSLLYIKEDNGFPGLVAIIPTIGTSLLLASGSFGRTMVGFSLSIRPAVLIGVVSFSLYLWHWPILAFYRYAYGELTYIGGIFCALMIVVFTLLSYFLVERPFRFRVVSFDWIRLGSIALMALAVSGVSLFSLQKNGVIDLVSPDEYQEKLKENADQTGAAYTYEYVCQVGYKPQYISDSKCLVGDKSKEADVFVFGDSNAAHYVGYLKVVAEEHGFTMRNIEHASCPPFPGELSKSYVVAGYKESCPRFNSLAWSNIDKHEVVFIGASWGNYSALSKSFYSDFKVMLDELEKKNKKVIIALKVPSFKGYDKSCNEKSIKIPFMNCSARSEYVDNGDIEANKKIVEMIKGYKNITAFSVRDLICVEGVCSAYHGGKPLYYDPGHLSIPGSEILGRLAVERHQVPSVLASLSK